MLMIVDSDFEEDDFSDLESHLQKSRMSKKRKKEDENYKEKLQLHFDTDKEEHLPKMSPSVFSPDCGGPIKKLKKHKNLSSRLKRLIKLKNRRNEVPNDPKLSPLYKEKEVKWDNYKSAEDTDNEKDSGIGSPSCNHGNSEENSIQNTTCKCIKFNAGTCVQETTCNVEIDNPSCSGVTTYSFTCSCLCGPKTCDIVSCHAPDITGTKCTKQTNYLNGDSSIGENRVNSDSQCKCDKINEHRDCCLNIPGPERIVAMDCEFVGLLPKNTSALGRCSIIDFHGNVLYDQYVKPVSQIMTYRTKWSGIRKRHMQRAIPFDIAQNQIREIIQGKVVVGHALHNDFSVLQIPHPGTLRRDTSMFKPLRLMADLPERVNPSLKNLSQGVLGRTIQQGEHCSIEDCKASLDLYKEVRMEWEQKLSEKKKRQAAHQTDPSDEDSCDEVLSSTKLGDSGDESSTSKTYLSDEFWPKYLFPDSSE